MFHLKQFIRVNGKTPINPVTGFTHSPMDPAIWMGYEEVKGLEHGFVFAKDDPYFFIDIDGCFKDGAWSKVATDLCNYFTGCYVEISSSKTGLHIIGKTSGKLPHINKTPGVELYSHSRYCKLTYYSCTGNPDHDATQQYRWLVENWFAPRAAAGSAEWTDYPTSDWNGPESDEEFIKLMLGSKSGASMLGGRASVAILWNSDEKLGNFFLIRRGLGPLIGLGPIRLYVPTWLSGPVKTASAWIGYSGCLPFTVTSGTGTITGSELS